MTTTPTWFCRPAARQWRTPAPETAAAPAFHAELPGYRPTDLTELPALAAELGVGRVFVKDESTRMGLGAFKVLGASWAVARLLLRERAGHAGRAAPGRGGASGRAGDRDRRQPRAGRGLGGPAARAGRAGLRAACGAGAGPGRDRGRGGHGDRGRRVLRRGRGAGRRLRRSWPAERRLPRRGAAAGAGHRVGGVRERSGVDRGGLRDPAGRAGPASSPIGGWPGRTWSAFRSGWDPWRRPW